MKGTLRRLVYRIHFVVASLAGGSGFLALSLLGVLGALIFRPWARRTPLIFARAFSGLMRAMLGWRIDVEGLPIYTTAAPAVLVANHQSNLDIVIYGAVFPPRTVAVGKKEIGKIPLFGWFFAVTGNILLDRANRQRALESIEEAAQRIRSEKVSVWMFPEGHRNQALTLLPFKKGAFHLALAARAPVVVTVCEPTTSLLDAHRWMVRPGRLRIRVLPPIPTEGRSDVDGLIEDVRALMQRTRAELASTARERIG